MIRDLLAIVEGADTAAPFLRAIASSARERDAHLHVVALTPSPLVAPGLAPFGILYVPEAVLRGDDESNIEAARALLKESGCRHEVTGLHDDIAWLAGDVRRKWQVADLIVTGTVEEWNTPWLRTRVLQTLIRSAGTPLLLLPAGRTLPAIRRAVLGWKPSPEATRALHDLVRLAEPGALIDVVTVGDTLDDCRTEQDTHAEVKRHLARHGLKAEGHWIVNDVQAVADTLTLYAEETGADLVAIGGFAHSRIREIMLGGVTQDLVKRANVPVLISR